MFVRDVNVGGGSEDPMGVNVVTGYQLVPGLDPASYPSVSCCCWLRSC